MVSTEQRLDQRIEFLPRGRVLIESEQWAQLCALQVPRQVETVQSRIGAQLDGSQFSQPVAHHALSHETGRVGQQVGPARLAGQRMFLRRYGHRQ